MISEVFLQEQITKRKEIGIQQNYPEYIPHCIYSVYMYRDTNDLSLVAKSDSTYRFKLFKQT